MQLVGHHVVGNLAGVRRGTSGRCPGIAPSGRRPALASSTLTARMISIFFTPSSMPPSRSLRGPRGKTASNRTLVCGSLARIPTRSFCRPRRSARRCCRTCYWCPASTPRPWVRCRRARRCRSATARAAWRLRRCRNWPAGIFHNTSPTPASAAQPSVIESPRNSRPMGPALAPIEERLMLLQELPIVLLGRRLRRVGPFGLHGRLGPGHGGNQTYQDCDRQTLGESHAAPPWFQRILRFESRFWGPAGYRRPRTCSPAGIVS